MVEDRCRLLDSLSFCDLAFASGGRNVLAWGTFEDAWCRFAKARLLIGALRLVQTVKLTSTFSLSMLQDEIRAVSFFLRLGEAAAAA